MSSPALGDALYLASACALHWWFPCYPNGAPTGRQCRSSVPKLQTCARVPPSTALESCSPRDSISCPYIMVSFLRGMRNLSTIAHIALAMMLVLRMPSQVAGAWYFGRMDSPNSFVCPTGSLPCRNIMQCVPIEWFCDGNNDCKDAVDGVSSDEKDCPTSTEVTTAAATTPELTTRITTPLVTSASEATNSNPALPSSRLCDVDDGGFPCMDGRCLLPAQVCDGVRDCSDGADEGRFCQLVGRGNQQPPLQPQQHRQRQSQRQPYQQPQQHHGLRGWLVDLRMQFRMLFQPLHDSSNLTSRE